MTLNMFDKIKDFFRKRKLSKYACTEPTGFMPLSQISSANIVIDVEEPGFDNLKEEILSWGRASGVKLNIYFLDLRRLSKEELLLTSIQTTILKKELDWTGYPDITKLGGLTEERCDLFLSMVDSACPAIDFISKCANARFKIGRRTYEGHAFDMVFSGNQTEDLRSDAILIFKTMIDYLSKIQ